MDEFKALVLPAFGEPWFEREILSQKVIDYICDAITLAGGSVHCAGSFCGLPEGVQPCELPEEAPLDAFFSDGGNMLGIVFFAPAPTITADDITGLIRAAEIEPVCLRSGKITIAAAGRCSDLRHLDLAALSSLPFIEADYMPVSRDAVNFLAAQDALRQQINLAHLERGVFLIDPATTFISPRAVLEPGCEILPGCMILGRSKIGAGSVIGPNCMIMGAEIGENVRVNASQIYESRVGARTTVGPFAYIRPGCDIGEGVRIGDFVELKKAKIGGGTKVSHLTYIGDSELGKRVNVGCGVVAVNYDGKSKHKTIVGDDCFIGCNVNLVAPLTIGDDVYLAAGSTITNDVESGALAIARARQAVKPQWVSKRRQEGKL